MNTLLLQPNDVLFFRDGRPMGGASSGQGAAWPLPTVINQAFHAALHRAAIEGTHQHRRGRSADYSETRDRKFGSLVTAGPFPVCIQGGAPTWFFPRPADAEDSGQVMLRPVPGAGRFSSLPYSWLSPVASFRPPSKETPKSWWSRAAWQHYLDDGAPQPGKGDIRSDREFADTEHTFGIEISAETGTAVEGQFYSAHYLRLREDWKMGVLAAASDKDLGEDLIKRLLTGNGAHILAGGQQRVCTATFAPDSGGPLPLPVGKADGFPQAHGKHHVKWILLAPAIWPEILAGPSKRGTERQPHPGGWLPTWICPDSGKVLLQCVDSDERRRRRNLNASGKGYASQPDIAARLVAALVGKSLPVSGYATPAPHWDEADPGGPKPTHLAVPAGSVYYFECDNADHAQALAQALNWHAKNTTTLSSRRSTLFGEKGLGLGVCGPWTPDVPGRPQT